MSREARWKWWEGGRLAELAERSLEESRTADAPAVRRSSSSRSRADGRRGGDGSPPSRSWRGQRPSGGTRHWPWPSGAPSRSRNACGRWRAGNPFATATRPNFRARTDRQAPVARRGGGGRHWDVLISPPARSRSCSRTSRARRSCCTSLARSDTRRRSPSTGALLREAFARHGGVEVDTQGDAFFVAFATAPDALAAAAEAQAALDGGPIRVRMGAAHRRAAGHGRGVRRHRRAPGSADRRGRARRPDARLASDGGARSTPMLRDLGEHRLKDLSAPERIYQLGDGDFPPLKTLYRTNLPVPATPFLGRERELDGDRRAARERGRPPAHADRAGRHGQDTARAAGGRRGRGRLPATASSGSPLAPLRDPALVPATAAQALGGEGALAEHVGDQRLLLVLDNFEHVLPAAREVAALLGACPNLDVVVTSRERLQLVASRSTRCRRWRSLRRQTCSSRGLGQSHPRFERGESWTSSARGSTTSRSRSSSRRRARACLLAGGAARAARAAARLPQGRT